MNVISTKMMKIFYAAVLIKMSFLRRQESIKQVNSGFLPAQE
jgi:hypothetical protein